MPKKTFKSKYKHMFCEDPKPEGRYQDIKEPNTNGESSYMAASAKLLAYSGKGGGGPVWWNELSNYGRGTVSKKTAFGTRVLDLKFNPFVDDLLAVGTEGCKVSIATLSEEEKEEPTTLNGHLKKVHLLSWHPTANSTIASCSWDKTVKLWNVDQESCEQTLEGAVAFSVEWNADGTLLGITDKSQNFTMVDPRTMDKATVIKGFCAGKKSSKVFFADNCNMVGFTCFSKEAKRMIQLRDIRKIDDKPLFNEVFDQQSSVLMPYYDEDSKVLFLAGKGDGTVFYKQLVEDDGRYLWDLSRYGTNVPQKGGCWVPKRGLDTKKCEIARFLKLTTKEIIPCEFTVPRKNAGDIFQADLYPEARSGLPSCEADEYFAGADADKLKPLRASMDPAKAGEMNKEIPKKMTYAQLAKENEALKAKIAELEAKIGSEE